MPNSINPHRQTFFANGITAGVYNNKNQNRRVSFLQGLTLNELLIISAVPGIRRHTNLHPALQLINSIPVTVNGYTLL